jgi:glycosyltransferase involved in cell wall biosynthesis
MDSAFVSVIINCYNGEEYLKETLESVINQTYRNWEIIFWDNCSTDSSSDILFLYNDSRIKYFKGSRNVPLGEARNLAIEKSQGKYIGFLDTDDIWEINKLELQVQKMESNPEVGVVHSNYINFWEGGYLLANNKSIESVESFQYLLTQYKIGMSAALIRKSVLEKYNIQFDKTLLLIEDFDFFLLIAYHSKVLYCKENLMRYRMHPNSLTNTSIKSWSKELNYLIYKLSSFLGNDELNKYSKELKWIKIRATNASIIECLSRSDRLEALKIILLNVYRSYKLLFPVIGVIFGFKNYTKTLQFIRKRNYRYNNEI